MVSLLMGYLGVLGFKHLAILFIGKLGGLIFCLYILNLKLNIALRQQFLFPFINHILQILTCDLGLG
jgi:hypothetical protein